eukprot:3892931-Amphidinium_carterae.1
MQSDLYQVASEQAQSQVRIAGSCVTSLVDCVRPRVQGPGGELMALNTVLEHAIILRATARDEGG